MDEYRLHTIDSSINRIQRIVKEYYKETQHNMTIDEPAEEALIDMIGLTSLILHELNDELHNFANPLIMSN